jgi:prepilin-type N-terminal cleavage/methylation domain-containing protein/prepilin-type processing-associated H-X9-DG protein
MTRHTFRTAHAAFTLIELLVVIGIIALLMAILLPALEKAREQANKTRCATHLQQLGQSLSLYSNENHGDYPRTIYVPGAPLAQGTSPAAPDPFRAGGPVPNDVTAALFLLIRTQGLPPKILTCPYNDVNTFEPDRAQNITGRSNFTDYRKNLGYSYANPYPDAAAVAAGYRLTNRMNPAFAVAADLNSGQINAKTGKSDNSANHEDEGQNVLFADGHVEWKRESDCGVNKDDIYRNQAGAAGSPSNPTDSVLLPTQK